MLLAQRHAACAWSDHGELEGRSPHGRGDCEALKRPGSVIIKRASLRHPSDARGHMFVVVSFVGDSWARYFRLLIAGAPKHAESRPSWLFPSSSTQIALHSMRARAHTHTQTHTHTHTHTHVTYVHVSSRSTWAGVITCRCVCVCVCVCARARECVCARVQACALQAVLCLCACVCMRVRVRV